MSQHYFRAAIHRVSSLSLIEREFSDA
jgi:hypothetical protein